jgi:hypothetical protein
LLCFFLLSVETLSKIEQFTGGTILRFLFKVGFAPANESYFFTILKAIWILGITEFSILQMLGLAFYILVSPFAWFLVILFRDSIDHEAQNQAKKQQKKRPVQAASFTVLLAWFLLYGNSNGELPLLLGLTATGIFLLSRLYTAFSYARPIDSTEAKGLFYTVTVSIANQITDKVKKNDFKNKVEIRFFLKSLATLDFFLRRAVILLRGRQGRSRAALLVLLQYVSNVTFLGVASVLFWAISIRVGQLPHYVSLADAYKISMSHIFPGISAPQGYTIPWILEAGISASSWILLVVYLGPAASMFPILQENYMKLIESHYKLLRTCFRLVRVQSRTLRRIETRLEANPQVNPVIGSQGQS